VIRRVRRLYRLSLAAALVTGLSACASGGKVDRVSSTPIGWPVDPTVASVSSQFGARRSGSWHQGIDLSAPKGTSVRATAAGKVVVAERSGAYGRTVVIDHGNGYRTRYAHLRRIAVEQGERVMTGEIIGKIGKSGNASGFHLHYEIVIGGTPVDPRPFMDGRPPPR
jgi:murein DD-endopeptidase MepM/ murein hydrolase activator NlpD